MKIAWFTPFDAESAIGKESLAICGRLSQRNTIDIWAYETENTLQTDINVVFYSPTSLDVRKLTTYDHIVYNMGNYGKYHWAIYEALQQFPGIVVLHDRTYFGFFMQYCEMEPYSQRLHDRSSFREILMEEYGREGADLYDSYSHLDVQKQSLQKIKYSCLHRICKNALGVFTHSNEFLQQVKCECILPVSAAYLPYKSDTSTQMNLPEWFERDTNKILAVSNGIVDPIKQIMAFTEVLQNDFELRSRIQYVVIGSYGGPYGERLEYLSRNELKDCLYMVGYQPYEIMMSFIQASDICVNLRYPNSEVCSLSLFEQMGCGKPVITMDTGVFKELPADTTIRLKRETLFDGLRNALHDIIDKGMNIEDIGHNAKRFIENYCSLDLYCDKLTAFLKTYKKQFIYSNFLRSALDDLNTQMCYLKYNQRDIPCELDDIVYRVSKEFKVLDSDKGNRTVVGIWAAFPYYVPELHREGIMRFMGQILYALMEYSQLCFEIWVYDINLEEIKTSFNNALQNKDYKQRMTIITETNWITTLNLDEEARYLTEKISIERDNLGTIAKEFSKAGLFVPVIMYLDNVLQTQRPICMPALDFVTKFHYEDFTFQNPFYYFNCKDIESKICRIFRRGATGYSMSKTVKQEQIIPCIQNVNESMIMPVWVPDMILTNENKEFSEKVLKRFGVRKPYLFYPTQLRPHKNMTILMQAMDILYDKYPELELVLTGTFGGIPELEKEWMKHPSYYNIKFACNLTDEELRTFYHYAACVPIPTLMEGGFPLQAIEAMAMEVPFVVSDIGVVRERLENCNFEEPDCGLLLFDPHNPQEFAEKIQIAFEEREKIVQGQNVFWEFFSKYTWKDAAESYCALFSKTMDMYAEPEDVHVTKH